MRYGELDVRISGSLGEIADAAAEDFAVDVKTALQTRDDVGVVLSKGGAQKDFIAALRARHDIDWSRIVVLHSKEYYGVSASHHASSRHWIKEHLLDYVHPKQVHDLRGDHEPIEEEVSRYCALIDTVDPYVCVINIGENGHLSFIDPPADFNTKDPLQLVKLDEWDRTQQVREGHFASLEESPEYALSMTINGMLRPPQVYIFALQQRMAPAVARALEGPVDPDCPASILTTAGNARLYLHEEAASHLSAA